MLRFSRFSPVDADPAARPRPPRPAGSQMDPEHNTDKDKLDFDFSCWEEPLQLLIIDLNQINSLQTDWAAGRKKKKKNFTQ